MSRGEHGNRGSGMGSKKIRRVLLAGAAVAVVAGNLVTWVGVGATSPPAAKPVQITRSAPVAPVAVPSDVRKLHRGAPIPARTFAEPRYPEPIGIVKQPVRGAKAPQTPIATPTAPAP